MKRFYSLFTVMTLILANSSHATESESSCESENELRGWEIFRKQEEEIRHRNQTRSMPESPKQKPKPKKPARKMPIGEYMKKRRIEKKRQQFRNSIREQFESRSEIIVLSGNVRLRRARGAPLYPKGRRYKEALLRFRPDPTSCIPLRPKAKTITIASVIYLFEKEMKRMNNWWLTISVTALYELLRGKKLILKLPLLPDTFKNRLANALRGGLYASITNAVLAEKLPPYHIKVKLLNGWKVIGNYMLIDLISTYGWDAIKKFRDKSAQNTDIEILDEKQDETKQSSKLVTIIDWAVKTILATAVPDLFYYARIPHV